MTSEQTPPRANFREQERADRAAPPAPEYERVGTWLLRSHYGDDYDHFTETKCPNAPGATVPLYALRSDLDAQRQESAGAAPPAPPDAPDFDETKRADEDKTQEALAMVLTSWLHDEQGSSPLGVDLMCEALDVTGIRLVRAAPPAIPPREVPQNVETDIS